MTQAVHGLFRLHQRVIVDFRPYRNHGGKGRPKSRFCQREGVQKELAVYCLVYNLVHAVMLAAAARQHKDLRRISFHDTIRWLV